MEYHLKAFLIGTIAALAALVLEFSILILFFPQAGTAIGQDSLSLLISAVFVEETIKFLILFKIAKNCGSRSIFFASMFFGIGFSLAEISINIYNVGMAAQNIPALAYIALLHLATCFIFGYILAKKAKNTGLAFAWLAALALHLFFNLAVLRQYIGYWNAFLILSFISACILIKFIFFSPKNLALPNQGL